MPSPIEQYRNLPVDEQRIVQVLSVIFEPVNQGSLLQVLDRLGWMDGGGAPLKERMDKPLRIKLLGLGVLEARGNRYFCNASAGEAATLDLARSGELEAVGGAAEAILPADTTLRGMNQLNEAGRDYRMQRVMRLGLYKNDFPGTMRAIGVRQGVDYLLLTPFYYDNLVKSFNRASEFHRWDGMDPRFRFMIFYPAFENNAVTQEDPDQAKAEAFVKGFSEAAKQHPKPALMLADLCLPRRMLSPLEEILAAHKDLLKTDFLGAAALLRGDLDQALEYFDQALALQKKNIRKRTNLYVPGFQGVLYAQALLCKGRNADAERQLKLLAKEVDEPWLEVFINQLNEVLEIRAEGRPMEFAYALNSLVNDYNPWFSLFRLMFCRWLGHAPSELEVQRLLKHYEAAKEKGFAGYCLDAGALLRALGKKVEAEAPSPELGRPLCELFKPEPAWERTLKALQGLAPGRSFDGKAPPPSNDRRLAWMLSEPYSQLRVEPREQKIGKNGKWTKGRPVALKRLRENQEEFDYLSDHDLRVCARISEDSYSSGWGGRYIHIEYRLPAEAALPALVGHPHVYWQDRPGRPLEVEERAVRLEVREAGKELEIRMQPPRGDADRLVHGLEGDKLWFTGFTAEQTRVADRLGGDGVLKVPAAAKERVLETLGAIAPLITVHSEIGGGNVEAEEIPAENRLLVRLQPQQGGLHLELQARPLGEHGPLMRPGEGARTLFAERDGKPVQAKRDLDAEAANADKVAAACPQLTAETGWACDLDDLETALEAVQQLQTLDDAAVLEWPQNKPLRLSRELAAGAMQMGISRQRDWFGLSGQLELEDGRVLEMERLLALLEGSPGRFISLGENEFLTLTKDLHHRLEQLRAVQDRGRIHPLAAGLVDEVTDGMQVTTAKPWHDQLKRIQEAQALRPEVPSTLQAELRDYQREGFEWLARLAHWGAGACLADDMGLGKTIQALALLLTRAPQGPALVLAPTSVCNNWFEEAQRFAPTLNPILFGASDRQAVLDQAGPFDLIICTYGLVQIEAERLGQVEWETIVADEAQAIKNPQAKRTKAVASLPGKFRMITTGTPIENHLGELWSLFRFINPGLLGSLERFNQRFANPIEGRNDAQARQRLQRLIRPFILRRLKTEVLDSLPPRTEITIHVEPSDQEKAFYEALRRKALEHIETLEQGPGQRRMQVLAEIMRLRRACCHPRLVLPESGIEGSKLEVFLETVDELLENRHKALVFSQFVDHLSLIREALDAKGIYYQYLDGSTPAAKRKKAVNAFQAGEGDLFLISLKAGGSGLNLTAADYVIHLDPWWNPAVEDQASDRAHRIGQQRPVTIYRLVTKGTIEDKIVDLHRQKRDLADSLLEGAEGAGKLSVDEMMSLLREDEEDEPPGART